MAAEEPVVTPLSLLFTFCIPESKKLVIAKLDELEMKDQLNLLYHDNISDPKSRKSTISSLHDKVPELRDCAHKRIRLKATLRAFYQLYVSTMDTAPDQWDETQIPFSFFIFLMERLRRQPVDDADDKEFKKDWKSADASWSFIHYLLRYCSEQKWGGQQLLDYFNEITQNGQKTNGFALKASKLICNEYKLKLGKYTRVRKQLPNWYTEALEEAKKKAATKKTQPIESPKAEQKESPKESGIGSPSPIKKTKSRIQPNTKWYWLDGELFQWVPYRDADQTLLCNAFDNKQKRCNVVNEIYRVEFDPNGSACGEQFKNGVKDPINCMVVCTEPDDDGTIHGMEVQDQPK